MANLINRTARNALAAKFTAARTHAQRRDNQRRKSNAQCEEVKMRDFQRLADAFQLAVLTGVAVYGIKYDLAAPSPYADDLDDLAREYYERTEAYDLTVCTGPKPHGRILPANSYQAGLINWHADTIRRELTARAERIGYTADQLKQAKHKYITRSRY